LSPSFAIIAAGEIAWEWREELDSKALTRELAQKYTLERRFHSSFDIVHEID
jgi:hypothetical protein